MATVTLRRYIPIPSGVYNLKILSYEEKESGKQKGSFYYLWKIQVTDALPEEYLAKSNGQDTFGVITANTLTEKNNLRKFLTRVGLAEIEVDQEVDLDTFLNHKFVGKVIVKEGTNGSEQNDLGEITMPEYDRFLERQKGNSAPKVTARPSTTPQFGKPPATGGNTASNQTSPPQRPPATPTKPAAGAPRPTAGAPRPTQRPPVTPPPADEPEVNPGDGTEDFPSQE